MPYKKFSLSLALMTAGLLVGCSDDDDNSSACITNSADYGNQVSAVISTVAPDYSGSDVQLVGLSESCFEVTSGILPSDQSDFTVEV